MHFIQRNRFWCIQAIAILAQLEQSKFHRLFLELNPMPFELASISCIEALVHLSFEKLILGTIQPNHYLSSELRHSKLSFAFMFTVWNSIWICALGWQLVIALIELYRTHLLDYLKLLQDQLVAREPIETSARMLRNFFRLTWIPGRSSKGLWEEDSRSLGIDCRLPLCLFFLQQVAGYALCLGEASLAFCNTSMHTIPFFS